MPFFSGNSGMTLLCEDVYFIDSNSAQRRLLGLLRLCKYLPKAVHLHGDGSRRLLVSESYATLCIKCGLCEKTCPILHPPEANVLNQTYAAISKDEPVRMSSSSGGVFSLLAEQILAEGGVVFGAKFDDSFDVIHGYAENAQELAALRTSKYVQSKIGGAYQRAKNFLQEGRTVLFSGTGCQIGGLVAYLGKPYEKLLTMDIICHGVPSPLVWRKYKTYREDKGATIEKVTFRSKSAGWKHYSLSLTFSDHSQYTQPREKDAYLKGFLQNLYLRPSCHHCSFKTHSRISDLTLADFWGIRRFFPDMDDRRGTSVVILHSTAAQRLFESIKDKMRLRETDLESGVKYNPSYTVSATAHPARGEFFARIGATPADMVDFIEEQTK